MGTEHFYGLCTRHQLPVFRYILERHRNDIRLIIGTGGQIPHILCQQFFYIFIQHKKYGKGNNLASSNPM